MTPDTTISPLAAELTELINSIREKRQPMTTIDDGVEMVRLSEAFERSLALGGKPQDLV